MKRRDWKRGLAFLCATALIAGSLTEFGPLTRVKAEETNLFTDGDMGDDGSDFWTAGNWKFEGATWSAADNIKYDQWAAYDETTSGLGINYGSGDGTVSMYQTIASLDAGDYTVTGWIKDTNSKTGSVTVYHGEDITDEDSLLNITSSFQQFTGHFTLEEAVTDYKVGFNITSEQGAWVCLDSLSLIRNTEDNTGDNENGDTEDDTEDDAEEDTGIVYENDFEDDADLTVWNLNWSVQEATSQSETGAGNNTTTVWNFWSEVAQNLTVSKTFTDLEAGNYKASFETAGGSVDGKLILQAGEDSASASMTVTAWDTYTTAETNAVILSEGATLTLTVDADFQAGGYFKMDNIRLMKVSDEDADAGKKKKLESLKSLIAEYEELSAGDYTEESWEKLSELLDDNKAYIEQLGDTLNFTVAEVENRITALTAAKEALVSASIVKADIYVEKVDGIKDDFIGGVDVSSYVSLKKSGVKYYDFAGNELDDQGFFNLLADSGINYVRVRVWNNPYDSNGNGYGGGNNDLDTAVKIGQWATNAGMRVLIDFHYSDFWADPDKQQAPKAWQGLTLDEKLAEVTKFTTESIQTLLDNGVNVGMVQVGNETNNGIAGESDWSTGMLRVFATGCDAVHAVADKNNHPIKAVLHFANPESGKYQTYAAKLAEANVNYDVFASSYYPYWHGTLSNLQGQLDAIAKTYEKEVMVAETSWATTLEDGDGHDNTVRDGNNDTDMPYDFSIYGQAKELREVINTIVNTTNGIGVFYWEPAWLPVQVYDADADNAEEVLQNNRTAWEQYGSGWAASYAGEYDAKDAGKWYGGSAVDNQALFDFSGHPLDTLNIFKYVKTGATTELKISVVKTTTAEAALGEEISLPEKVTVTYSDGTSSEREVTWNAEQIKTAQENGAGEYRITGEVVLNEKKYEAICKLTISPENILPDGGFESGADTAWTIDGNGVSVKADSSNVKKGTYCLHFWADTEMNYTATQTVTLDAGVYTFGGYLQGSPDGTDDTYEIYVSYDGQEQTASVAMNGWQNWSNPEIKEITITKNNTEITLGIRVKASANIWGAWDEMYLYRIGDVTETPVVTPQPSTPEPAQSSSSDSDTAAPAQTVDWNTVTANVQDKIAEVTQNPNINSVNMNIVCSGETKLPATVLESIQGSNMALALHNGNGVAISISGQDLKGTALNALQSIDLTVNSDAQNIPAAVVASKNADAVKQLSVQNSGVFPVPVNIHVSVGAENSGKSANLYRYNEETKQLEYCASFPVTRNGQSMFALKQGGDYMVTVTATQPKETVYFAGGDYTVKAGDTLSVIAARSNISLTALKAKNPQIKNIHKIRVGQKINLN